LISNCFTCQKKKCWYKQKDKNTRFKKKKIVKPWHSWIPLCLSTSVLFLEISSMSVQEILSDVLQHPVYPCSHEALSVEQHIKKKKINVIF